MRLRVTVHRHGLPDTPIIWNIDTSIGPTVYQLLEQINEIIPVESDGEWGLEDYAVELKGSNGVNYECLHFQPVANVMKEDDEVLIRPLLSQDLKIRRISGRRQISSSGAHLVDGVVFGRPLLRRPDRPAIDIPPRKKRRITEGDDAQEEGLAAIEDKKAEDSEDHGSTQLLHADFDDENSEDDEDFVSGGSETEASEEDTEELEHELQELEDDDENLDLKSGQMEESSMKEVIEPCLSDVKDAATRANIRKLHVAFPKSKLAVCKYVLSGTDFDMGEAYEALTRGFRPVKPKTAVTEILQDQDHLLVPKTRTKTVTTLVKESENVDSMQAEADKIPNPLVDYYDQNGLPAGSITSGRALSFMADAAKISPARRRPDSSRSSVVSNKSVRFALDRSLSNGLTSTPFIDEQSGDDQSSEEGEGDSSDESSSSDDESSSAVSDSSSEEEDANESSSSDSDSDSDSSSESSSDNEEPEETSSKPSTAAVPKANKMPSSKSDAATPKPHPSQHIAFPSGGKKATHKRNERRQKANALNRFKEKGILPAGITLAEFRELYPEQLSSSEIASAALDKLREARQSADIIDATARTLSKEAEFEKRRQDLLASLANGGIEVGISSAHQTPNVPSAAPGSPGSKLSERRLEKLDASMDIDNAFSIAPSRDEPPEITKENTCGIDIDEEAKNPSAPETAKGTSPVTSAQPPPTSEATSRPARRKLDLGAGRRLLFGSLGIKTPKTKQDEDKVRQDLMKDVRPLVTPNPIVDPQAVLPEANDEDPDAWKAKITYRAVECVYEGVELSEPPFPFVQRWDPHQQSSWSNKGGRGGKRKKDQRDQSQYYDNSRASKKQKRRKGKHNYPEEHEYLEEPFELSYDDTGMQHDGSMLQGNNMEGDTRRQMNDTQEKSSPDDLVALPDDPSTLPDLRDGAAKVGMTIAFKFLEMNAATRWQPQVSPYRTAIVISITDGGELQLSLAKRDRAPAKVYDDETGERIYDKFEMPDDDEMDEDEGNLNLSFAELLDPKIVQEPLSNISDTNMEESLPSKETAKVDTSANLSSAEEPAEAQFSHVTETVLNSDAPESISTQQAIQIAKDIMGDTAIEDIPDSQTKQTRDAPESISTQEALELMKDIIGDSPETQVVQTHETPMADPETADDEDTVNPTTPTVRTQSVMSIGVLTPSQQISEENRKAISHMMKEAGFRSSIPSIVRGMDGAMDSPSDTAAFEKLINDMSGTHHETPYSPKFNGLGSSPRDQEHPAKSIALESSPSPEQLSRHRFGSSIKPTQPSWETVESRLESPAPSYVENGESFDERTAELLEAHISPSSPTPEPPRQEHEKVPTRKVPVGRAQALWELQQPKSRRMSNDSSIGSEDISQEGALSPAVPEEKDSSTSVQYPKLSGSSSFISQITDHERQPDYDFGDSALTHETHKISNPGMSSSLKDSQHWKLESEKTSVKSVSKAKDTNRCCDSLSDSEPELPTRKPINGHTNDASHLSKVLEEISSDEFPTLESLSQQARTIKPEKSASVPPKSKEDRSTKKALDVLDEEVSDDDDETTPKPSQKQRQASQSRFAKLKKIQKLASQSRSTSSQSSQPRASQTRLSQGQPIIPQGSQFMIDLTQSSAVEPEPQPPASEVDSDESRPKKIKRYELDDDEELIGWVSKKSTTLHGLGRRHTSNGIKHSSQADLNARNRRKTTGR